MNARFFSLNWIIEENFQKDSISRKNAKKIKTFSWKRIRYELTVETDFGDRYSQDLYSVIKYFAPKLRITQKFRKDFEKFLKDEEFVIGEHDNIEIYEKIRIFCNSWEQKDHKKGTS